MRRPLSWRDWVLDPFVLATVACVALAALSAVTLPTVPSYDPWSWVVWGREVSDPHLSFIVSGGPSWKPLPLLFTAVFGLFGGAAPTLWVLAARAGGLLGLVGAYRLAAGLVQRSSAFGDDGGSRWAAPLAGVLAAAAILLTQDWFYYMFRGTSEPMLIGLSLWAIDRHLAGRYWLAFVLGVADSMIRPEAWPFIILYALWMWWRDPRVRVAVTLLIGLIAIPVAWFGPPWVGSNNPFLAAQHAKDYNGHLGSDPFLTVLHRGVDLQTVPILVLALVAVALAGWRERDRLTLGLAAAAAGWWVIVVGMTLDGYPGLERFFLPAAAVACVLAGVAVVQLAWMAASLVGGRRSFARRMAPAGRGVVTAGAIVVVLVAATVALTTSQIDSARAQEPTAAAAVKRLNGLSAAVAAVGGHKGVFPCKSSFAAVNHSVQTALAWKLHVTLERVGTTMSRPGVMFVGPHDSIDGGAAAVDHRLTSKQLIAHVGVWYVYRMTTPGLSTACVGS